VHPISSKVRKKEKEATSAQGLKIVSIKVYASSAKMRFVITMILFKNLLCAANALGLAILCK
jgi:hypothetical protein